MTPRPMTPGRLTRTLERLASRTETILVGPWLGEVGYELLYWIPFLSWAQQTYGIAPERCVVVSRGGCAAWYRHVATRYLDILSWYSQASFVQINAQRILHSSRKSPKQPVITSFDRDILAKAQASLEEPAEVLHPSLMYSLMRHTRPWKPGWYAAAYQPFLPVTPLDGLPERYVAVRCYTSQICPDTSETRDRLTDLVRDLLMDTDVVLVHTGTPYDDHLEFPFRGLGGRLHSIADRCTPATNLEVQTRAIAGATKFVGTYGGYAYLAPLLGVGAETVYAHRPALAKLDHHLKVARRVFQGTRYGWLNVADLYEPQEAYACAS